MSIVSYRDLRFTSRFWEKLQEALDTRLNFSTAFHPQTDGQSEIVIQVLEDFLRSCVIDYEGSWDRHIPLVNLCITIASSRVLEWHLTRLSTEGNVEHHYVGQS